MGEDRPRRYNELRARRGAAMANAKKLIARVLENLPDDCSIEDVQYHLYVVAKICRRLALADRGKQYL
jgi:hypothetical protein